MGEGASARPFDGLDDLPAPVPPLLAGQPPLAILVDYDGTIAKTDVSDAILARYVTADWEAHVAEYDAGRVGSRRLMEWEIGLIDGDPLELMDTAARQPHDPGFRPFAERALAAGIPVEVVSDGFGFFIKPALRALGLPQLPVVTARTTFGSATSGARGPRIEFPNGNPECLVCGTCKRNRVLAHQETGRAVVFIGDGPSDRYAAGYSDKVFAKHALEQICVQERWPYDRWSSFDELDEWLERTLASFARDPASLPGPTPRPLFCGAEVWGPGRFDPVSDAAADAKLDPRPDAPADPATSDPSARTPRTPPSRA
jgi:2-hydroxy-3-keto-5-methylthiopentenyl-1-phosphate phosphatase